MYLEMQYVIEIKTVRDRICEIGKCRKEMREREI